MVLHAWVEAIGADDMDLFVAIHKLDAEGRFVPFIFYSMCEDGPVALGWLRASHRALDAARSRPDMPVHPHDREERLAPGEIVPVDIEIWPSSTRFDAGETLRLVVMGRDTVKPSRPNAPVRPARAHPQSRHACHPCRRSLRLVPADTRDTQEIRMTHETDPSRRQFTGLLAGVTAIAASGALRNLHWPHRPPARAWASTWIPVRARPTPPRHCSRSAPTSTPSTAAISMASAATTCPTSTSAAGAAPSRAAMPCSRSTAA